MALSTTGRGGAIRTITSAAIALTANAPAKTNPNSPLRSIEKNVPPLCTLLHTWANRLPMMLAA
jgi:hypothetical protein